MLAPQWGRQGAVHRLFPVSAYQAGAQGRLFGWPHKPALIDSLLKTEKGDQRLTRMFVSQSVQRLQEAMGMQLSAPLSVMPACLTLGPYR